MACDATLLGAVVDAGGDVLALGRTRRLVSRAQRRALMVRDRMCQFPGCARTRHLHAHHVVSWAAGGPTDLNNLVLLCGWHHTAVHEGGVTIHHKEKRGDQRWCFRSPDGQPLRPPGSDTGLVLALEQHEPNRPMLTRLAAVDRFDHLEARAIRPGWAGEPFSLHDCVRALFEIQLPETADQLPEAA